MGVSFDGAEANAAFAASHEFGFRLLCDTERILGLAYHACEKKEDQYPRRITYVIDASGRIEQSILTKSPGAQAGELLRYFESSA